MLAETRDEAFRTHLEPHRRAITLHCYRLLGSLQDAEELAQESLLRGWQRLAELRSHQAARSWLYRIATNACLDALKGRRRRALPHHLAPPADPALPFGASAHDEVWVEPAPNSLLEVAGDPQQQPDVRMSRQESIGLAFITALQLLPPRQRAVLLLIDVVGCRPSETAELLKTTEASVNSLLQRARKSLETRRVEPEPLTGADEAALLQRFITTWQSGDLDAFTALLAEDAVLAMPPQPEWYAGRTAIRQFFKRLLAAEPRQYHLVPIRANGAPALALYARPPGASDYQAAGITVLTCRQGFVAQMTRFTMPRLFPLFGLPQRVPGTPA